MQGKDAVRLLGTELRHVVLATDRLRTVIAARLHIGVTELTALGYLVEAGQLTPKELGARLGITPGSVTGVADRLVDAGFLARHPHPSDRRSLLLRPTPVGIRERRWADDQVDAILARAIDHRLEPLAPDLARLLSQAASLLLDSTKTHHPAAAHDP
jgi:DNA-binding MarR family transcriptional regulator